MPALISTVLRFLISPLGIGALAALLIGVQTARLHNAKADQIDPAAHQPWKTEAKASAKALAECQAAKSAAEDATARANASVEQLAAMGGTAMARVQSQIADVSGQVTALRKSAASLKGYQPKGADLCARWNDADAKVRGALQ